MKKVFSLLLIFTLLLSLCPTAVAVEIASGTCGAQGDNVLWSLDSNGTLTLSGSGKIKNCDTDDDIYPEWYDIRSQITSVVIGEGITSVGYLSFYDCMNLSSATFPSTLTSIEGSSFYGTNLSAVDLPYGLLSIGERAFYGTQITSLVLPDTVTYIGPVFAGYKLTNITLSANLTTIGSQAFASSERLKSITIPANVKYINDLAFEGSSLKEITFLGDSPSIAANAFFACHATCYYPYGNSTWDNAQRTYGGTLTWDALGAPDYSFSFSNTAVSKGDSATVSLNLDTEINVMGATMAVEARDASGNELEISSITVNEDITDGTIDVNVKTGKILIASADVVKKGKLADITFATDANTVAGEYTVTLTSDVYTGTMEDGTGDEKLDFEVIKGTIDVSERSVTITFNTNGGSKIDAITQNYGTAITAPNAPTKTGYTFAGWDKEIPSTMPAENMTITAMWTVNQYTITFDTDGGSTIDPITQNYGTAVTKPAAPTKTGYTFAGWDIVIPSIMPAGNMTVTAKWTVNQYTITFNTNGGSAIDSITQNYGTAVNAPDVPTKTGYTFAGWDRTIPSTMPAGDLTITAIWTANQYTITFNTDGGSTIDPITQNYGTAVTAPDSPTKMGYTFVGWDKTIPSTMPAENLTITAMWMAENYGVSISGGIAGAELVIVDSENKIVPLENGKYNLIYGETYSYTMTAIGYKTVENCFTVSTDNENLEFDETTAILTLNAMELFIGDVDNDKNITVSDAQRLYNYLLDMYTVDPGTGLAMEGDTIIFNLNVADINKNNHVGADDILPMLRLVINLQG